MLGELESKSGRLVVADLEQGVGTVSRLGPGHVDRLVLVVEPHVKSLETARRARAIADEVGIGDLIVVANRVAGDEDLRRIEEALPGIPIVAVPDDAAVRAAERAGEAPFDRDPGSPAMVAISSLLDRLLAVA